MSYDCRSRRVLTRPPERRHLMDRQLMFRAFVIMAPVEALFSMAAFPVVLFGGGWVRGEPWDGGVVLTASGAAFAAVVLGQLATAFACRSATSELAALALFLYVPPVAAALGQAPPPVPGLVVALSAIPGVLLADWLHKRLRQRPEQTS
ncbi:cation-translocating P-type ATPase C-terminal domain-containing protein [Arthrobacter sp. H20]|uniref:cation transporting ATPase C-terminal domain-containing protein n=1 Tax=Arthrobacter sp. H20 TaxID=1267981 RepID=UPI0009DFD12E